VVVGGTLCGCLMTTSEATTVAGIDCGTNSIRLLIARPGPDGLVDVHREMRVVRLGEGVDATGSLSAAALARTEAALADYAALIRDIGVDSVRMVATSASRDASNAGDFSAMVRRVLGVEPQVISGTEEAALSFAGAIAGLPRAANPLLVADIGGGSTELVLGSPVTASVSASYSMDVGCVRMTERHLRSDPPTEDEIAATVRDVRSALDAATAEVAVAEAAAFVGVAGTVTTIAAIALGLPAYDPDAIHATVLTRAQVTEVAELLLAMTRDQRAALPVMHPGRVDVIGGGAIVLQTVMEYVGAAEVIVSEHDILDGIALSLL
jgi:exopolyphosphatase/guanosine-5'-triphosphate,3'-diphosphate pyrophosphatase